MALSLLIAGVGAFLGYRKYSGTIKVETTKDPFRVDEFYGAVVGRGVKSLASFFGRYLEDGFFQKILQVSGAAVDLGGNLFKTVQTGSAQGYLLMMVLALIGLMFGLVFGVNGYGN